jgi:hypothetical protein
MAKEAARLRNVLSTARGAAVDGAACSVKSKKKER